MPNVYILPDQRLVDCGPGEAILSAALRAGVPFAHACGGHASCSTCRVVVLKGWEACAARTPKETAVAERLCFGPDFRLACQTKVAADVTIRRLVLDERDIELADIRTRFDFRRPRSSVQRALARRRPRLRPLGDEVAVAVLFADIRGFTAFAGALLPYDVIHVLQRQLDEMTLTVKRHGGVVTSYMGDGIMALFGPEQARADRRAVVAGLEMLATTDRRGPQLQELYGRTFDLNVGLHVGTAIVGSVWGAPDSVTAIGDTVNLASRIEQANKSFGTRFLMSAAAHAALGDEVSIGRTVQCELAGKAGSFELVEVLGMRAPPDRG
jgi:adenylate cyclase